MTTISDILLYIIVLYHYVKVHCDSRAKINLHFVVKQKNASIQIYIYFAYYCKYNLDDVC